MDATDFQVLSGVAILALAVFALRKIQRVTPKKDKRLVIAALLLATMLAYAALI
ncbi:MAG: hypothetical protein WDN47_04275 [Candidatus Doudnabacteria bacterium]